MTTAGVRHDNTAIVIAGPDPQSMSPTRRRRIVDQTGRVCLECTHGESKILQLES